MNSIALAGMGFFLLTVLFFGSLLLQINKAINLTAWSEHRKKRTQTLIPVFLFLWAIIVSIAAWSGFSSNFEIFPLNAAPFLLIPLITIGWITFSAGMREILQHLPSKVLCLLQVFRVFVELLLWKLFVLNQLPEQMTFEGRNWDILSGIAGLLVGLFFMQNRRVVLVYNLLGLVLLINIVGTALLSMPTPFRVFMQEPANTIVLKWPFIFLPTFLVPLAYGLHFLSWRQLWLSRKGSSTTA
jgi:hypothetical protein